jgi:hypothetical protein
MNEHFRDRIRTLPALLQREIHTDSVQVKNLIWYMIIKRFVVLGVLINYPNLFAFARERGAGINDVDRLTGKTLAHALISQDMTHQHLNLFRDLLTQGLAFDMEDRFGNRPFDDVDFWDELHISAFMIAMRVKPDIVSTHIGSWVVHHNSFLRRMVALDVDPSIFINIPYNHIFKDDKDRIAGLSLLLELGANVNHTDQMGRTPLFYTQYASEVVFLLDRGANPFHRDINGDLALQYLSYVFPEQEEAYRLLMRFGELKTPNSRGQAAISMVEDGEQIFEANKQRFWNDVVSLSQEADIVLPSELCNLIVEMAGA